MFENCQSRCHPSEGPHQNGIQFQLNLSQGPSLEGPQTIHEIRVVNANILTIYTILNSCYHINKQQQNLLNNMIIKCIN